MAQESKQRFPLRVAYPFASENGLASEVEEIQEMEIEWNRPYGPTVRRGYILYFLKKKDLLERFLDEKWPYGKSKSGQAEIASCLRIKEEFDSFISSGAQPEDSAPTEEAEDDADSFALEAHLRDFLAKNLERIEPGLRLFEADGRNGVEFPVAGGRIDILAVDGSGNLVVVELKLSKGRNKTLGQLLYYMGWVDQHLANGKQSRGIIIAKDIGDELVTAVSRVPGVSLVRYKLSFAIEPVSSNKSPLGA